MAGPNQHLLLMLDAATYFFVNSGVFIAVTAGIFFFLGLWFGRLQWGRYKRLLREADEVIESFKTEVSTLKRRMIEQPARAVTLFTHSPPLALAPMTLAKGPFFPVSRAFYIWGEPDWEQPRIEPRPPAASKAFSIWTGPDFTPKTTCLSRPSRATTLWTQPDWAPRTQHVASSASSRAFSIWTEPDYKPVLRALTVPSRAFTLWTVPDRLPVPAIEKLPASRAHGLWTGPDFAPQKRILFPHSAAFSLWTDESWVPDVVYSVLPQSQAFSIWTEKSWKPPVPRSAGNGSAAKAEGGSVFGRAISVAKNIFGRSTPPAAPSSPAAAPAPDVFIPHVPILQDLPHQPPVVLRSDAVETVKPVMHFMAEIVSGRARHDPQLGVVYKEKPAVTDNLTALKGIGDVIEHQLNDMGIYTFKQIALWSDNDAHEISHRLAFKDRVLRENWCAQARELYFNKYGQRL